MKKTVRFDKNGKMIMTEAIVRKQIKDYLKHLVNMGKCVFWHNLQGLGCYEGIPDLEGFYMGKHFFLEVKSPRGGQRPGQVKFQQMVESQGGVYYIADNIETVERILPL